MKSKGHIKEKGMRDINKHKNKMKNEWYYQK